jgi:hypothetical protein
MRMRYRFELEPEKNGLNGRTVKRGSLVPTCITLCCPSSRTIKYVFWSDFHSMGAARPYERLVQPNGPFFFYLLHIRVRARSHVREVESCMLLLQLYLAPKN